MKYLALLSIVFFSLSFFTCRKKSTTTTTTTPPVVHYDTFTEVRKFKSIGTSTITYFIASKYTDGTYDLTPFFIYAKGTKTSSSSLLESYTGKSYYTNGKTNQIENLTLQKIN